MGIKQLYNDNLRKLPIEYGDVSVMQSSTDYLSLFVSSQTYCSPQDILRLIQNPYKHYVPEMNLLIG